MDFSQQPPPWPPDPPEAAIPTGGRKRKALVFASLEEILGKLVGTYAADLRSKGWRKFVRDARGRSHITPTATRLHHKAARLLGHLGTRVASVTMKTARWSRARRDHAVDRGPHKASHGEREFVCDEMLDFSRQDYWVVLPSSTVATCHTYASRH